MTGGTETPASRPASEGNLGARTGCPESRLSLPLYDSPPSGLQAKKFSFSLGRVFRNLRPLVTSSSLVPSGQHTALRGGLLVGPRSWQTFRSELLVLLLV